MAHAYHQDEYAAKKEGTIIVLMALLIVASVVGAYSLYKVASPECNRRDYIYCGDPALEHEQAPQH